MTNKPSSHHSLISRHLMGVAAACIAASLLQACGDDQPKSPLAPTSPPTGTPTDTLRALQLLGPDTVHIGQTADFKAIGQYADGTDRDLTSEVNWSFSPTWLVMSAPGRFTGINKGEGAITIAFSGLRASRSSIIVVPPGTFRVSGAVRDEGAPVPGARITVENEVFGNHVLTPTGADFTVYGVAGPVRITVIRDGYVPVVKNQVINDHQRLDIQMVPANPRRDVSGRYALTIAAAPECVTLPPDARVRTYTAFVTQSGPHLEVTLEGGRFLTQSGRTHNQFAGVLEPTVARFTLTYSWFDYYHYFVYLPDIFETLPDNTLYGVEGFVNASLSADGMSGSLSGAIGAYPSLFVTTPQRCNSQRHQLSFAR